MSLRSLAIAAGLCASAALARTDLAGCTYTDLVIRPTQQADYASRLYYVPDTGEVCAFLDCGGGRAPPKTTVPGCPQYKGTDTYKPSYVDPKTLGDGVLRAGTTVVMATEPVTAAASSSTTTSAASAPASSSGASATSTEKPSVTILTGTNTGTASGSGSSSAHVTSAASSASGAASSSGAAKTTSPSSAAGAMQTVGAILGPCVMAAVAALA
ncbi:hypothetical protein ISF_07746 [Cordyceps fumosorosea ARSEF 2679]|uniref:Siderophore biosynthesis enzyme n=1 Tax=Cordyceps fumosorosea (strain ARSEF 2679) TaxID=1081104 RepID=A0A167NK82_CORFA|nr:hypothetical protein ISF_07746 [Cordyceps fumosorosea ARSEF 2679]OAA55641.1 hypothetical protein ISF_07746 [Cordyceps fumosorosea ARSEF 2679]